MFANLDHLISSLENFQNYDGLAFNSKGTATVAALAPMDLRLSGKINTLLVGPEAPGINIIQERGLVESMLVLELDSNLFLGGYVRKLYAARTVTVSTLHRHTPCGKNSLCGGAHNDRGRAVYDCYLLHGSDLRYRA